MSQQEAAMANLGEATDQADILIGGSGYDTIDGRAATTSWRAGAKATCSRGTRAAM